MLSVQAFPHRDTTEDGRGIVHPSFFIRRWKPHWIENTEFLPKDLTRPLFARVLFAKNVLAYRSDFYDQTTATGHATYSGEGDFV